MSKWHNQVRDVAPWGSATDDANTPPDILNKQFRLIQTDLNGNLYVIPLVNSPGGGVETLPTSALGTTQNDGNTALVGMQSPLLWAGASNGNYEPQGGMVAALLDPTPTLMAGRQAALVADFAEWSLTHTPAVGVRATSTRASVPNARHVCRSITATLSVAVADVAVAGVLVNLRDGATGAGTILWSDRLAIIDAAGGLAKVAISGLNIVGSLNTAMTLEFAAAPGAASFESVAWSGRTAGL